EGERERGRESAWNDPDMLEIGVADLSVSAWNDPDMLEVGVADSSEAEMRTHFSLWCLYSAPLILGLNVTEAAESPFTLDLLTNQDLLDIDRDPLGIGADVVVDDIVEGGFEVWMKPMQDGYAFGLFARTQHPGEAAKPGHTVYVHADLLGLAGLDTPSATVLDVFAGTTFTVYQGQEVGMILEEHDTWVLRVYT
ncbi:glycoside hydrolase, family 27, partial [Kipferlia bialata]